MNERIRELAEQAKLQPYYDAQAGQIQKFAELIIEECARRCDIVRENVGGDRQFGARLCADEIRSMNRRS